MEDMSPESKIRAGVDNEVHAQALGKLLEDHKGTDIIVIDLRPMNTWTDFFVIATASSSTHLEGMERHIKEFVCEHELEIIRRSPKPVSHDDEWRILDLGPIVIHLMSGRTRSFYELERLYPTPQAKIIYRSI